MKNKINTLLGAVVIGMSLVIPGKVLADSGIDMAAGDGADRKGHREHGQAEGERDAEEPYADVRKGGGNYCAPATAQHQPESAEKLRRCAPGERHTLSYSVVILSRVARPPAVATPLQ